MEYIRKLSSEWRSYIFSVLIIAASTLIFIQGRAYFAKEQWALLYLLIIVFVASRGGVRPAILAAIVAFFSWNFFFLPPYHTFHIYDPKDWLSLFAFLIVGIIMGTQTGRLREREALARMRGQETALLNTFSAHLVSDISVNELADVLAKDVAGSMNARCAVLFTSDQGRLTKVGLSDETNSVDEQAVKLVKWSFHHSKAVGLPEIKQDGWPVSVSHADAESSYDRNDVVIPLQTATRQLGVLYIGDKLDGKDYTASEARLLLAVANQATAFLERKQLHTIAIQADALLEADRMKSTFVSSISHELKTPLASITATLTNLMENDLNWDENTSRIEIGAVLEDLERLNDSISSLVDLSRLESAAWHPNREWYELGEMLGTVMSRIPQKRRDRIVFSLPDELPLINVDYAQWVRVLSNLIENALDYTGEDTKVYVGASDDGSDTKIWVEDEGPGISPEEKRKIFEKFYRGSTSLKIVSGTGLGLAIAKEIVRFHSGNICVEDVDPHGARFVISLPHNAQDGATK